MDLQEVERHYTLLPAASYVLQAPVELNVKFASLESKSFLVAFIKIAESSLRSQQSTLE